MYRNKFTKYLVLEQQLSAGQASPMGHSCQYYLKCLMKIKTNKQRVRNHQTGCYYFSWGNILSVFYLPLVLIKQCEMIKVLTDLRKKKCSIAFTSILTCLAIEIAEQSLKQMHEKLNFKFSTGHHSFITLRCVARSFFSSTHKYI